MATSALAVFEQTSKDWQAADLYQKFQRFQEHVNFSFQVPLVRAKDKDKVGWLGLWIGLQDREVFKTITWVQGEKDKPDVIL